MSSSDTSTNDLASGKRWRRLILIGFILVLVAASWWIYGKVMRIRRHASVILTLLPKFQSLSPDGLEFSQLDSLRQDLGQLERALQGLEGELRFPLWLAPHLGWLPRVGPTVAAGPSLLTMAIELSSGGYWALLGTEPLLDLLPDGDFERDVLMSQAVNRLAISRPYFLQARDGFSQARTARGGFDRETLIPKVAELLVPIDEVLPLAQLGTNGALLAPTLLGAEAERTFLLLAQNSHELRPTGGLISGVGVLRVKEGAITELTLEDSYAYDDFSANAYPPAPEPLARYMWAGVLSLRDANWSPDFPTSAEVIAGLYQLGEGERVDGVIAADLYAVQLLVDAIGPLQLEGYDQPITGANVITMLQAYWGAPVGEATIAEQGESDWWRHRKDVMGDLVDAALTKVQSNPWALDPYKMVDAGRQALRGKHVLIHLRDPEAANVLAKNGWDGAIEKAEGDYLMVVDANLGFNKVDANIKRRVDYSVQLDQRPAQAELRLVYDNTSPSSDKICRHDDLYGQTRYQAKGYEDLMTGCYWDYVRVYVPGGSTLIKALGTDEPVRVSQEQGKTVFATFILVPPGQARELRFVYTLPSWGELADYRVMVQKQPGLDQLPVSLDAKLPSGAHGPQASAGDLAEGRWQAWSALTGDQIFQVTWQEEPSTALYIVGLTMGGLAMLAAGFWTRRRRDHSESVRD